MSIIYNPYDVFVVQRNADSSSFVEKVLSSAPNSLFFFDSASNVVALPSSSIAAGTASYALFADTASFSPGSVSSSHALNADSTSYLNPGVNIYLDNSYIFANTTSVAPVPIEGQLWWDSVSHTYTIDELQSRLQIGQENYVRVIAGEFIPNGSAIYINGTATDPDNPFSKLPVVYLAIADGTGTKSSVIGLATQDINIGERGFVTTQGIINDIDTFLFSDGDVLYLSDTTPGGWTNILPLHPAETIVLGSILYSHHAIGRILVSLTAIPHSYVFVGPESVPSISLTGSVLNVESVGCHLCTTDDGYGEVKHFIIPSSSFIVSSPFLDVQYVIVSYNSGSPEYQVVTNQSSIDNIQIVPIATFQVVTGLISYMDWDAAGILLANKNNQRIIDLYGIQRSSGMNLSVSASNIIVSEGTAYIGVKKLTTISASTANSQFVLVGHSSSLWHPYGLINGWINDRYDDETNVLPLSSGSYVINYVWRGVGSIDRCQVFLSNQYSTYADAVSSLLPESPPEFTNISVFLGRIITQQGNSNVVLVESAFTKIISVAGITDHNLLNNLQGGQSGQYYHLTAAEYGNTNSGSFVRISQSINKALSASYIVPGATFYQVSGSNGVPPAYIEPCDYSPESSIYTPPYKAGRIFFDNRYNDWAWYAATGSGATSWRSHLGKEISFTVHNPYSVTLSRLSVVYVGTSSIVGAYYPDVYLAQADGTGQHASVLGVIRNDIPSGSTGFCMTNGVMHRTNMGTFQIGDKLWLSPTVPGGLTTTQPGQPNEQVLVGYCSEAGTLGSFICRQSTYPPPVASFAGITSNVSIQNNNNGTITVSTGSVNLYSDPTGVGIITPYGLVSRTFTLTTGSVNYIVAEHSGSSMLTAWYNITTDSTYANGISIVRVAELDANYKGPGDWEVHEFDVGIVGLALANRTNNKDILLYGFQRQDGLTLYTSGSNGDFGVTAGNVWYGPNSHILDGVLSSNSESCDTYHYVNSASVWTYTNTVGYDNSYYNGTGGLVPMAPNSWSVEFVYRIVSNQTDVALILASQQFLTELEASNNAQTPPNLPNFIANMGLLIGDFVFKSGSYANTIVQSAYAATFVPSVVTQHNSLLGIQGGTGGQYYHMTLADYTGTGTGVMMRSNKPVFTGATPGNVPYWDINGSLTLTGSITVTSNQYLIINSGSPSLSPIGPETLLVKQLDPTSETNVGAHSNVNDFSQIYNQNHSSGTIASTDFCATADIGNQSYNYIDMGIASSGYNASNWPWVKPLDGYIDMDGGDLWLATISDNKIKFAFNNTASTNYIDKTGFYLSGSWFGTSSWANKAISASWSPNQGATTLFTASTYQITASNAISASWSPFTDDPNALSASWASQSLSASYSYTSSIAINAKTAAVVSSLSNTYGSFTSLGDITAQSLDINNGNLIIDGNGILVTTGYISSSVAAYMSVSGSLFGTSSWSKNAVSASWASQSLSASWALQSLSASWASTSPATTLFTASTYQITSSRAITASFALGIPTIKAGAVSGSAFSGTPMIKGIAFAKSFVDNNYSVVVTGEASRTWTIQSKLPASFIINSNNNATPTGMVFWQAIYSGEYYS